MSTIVHDVSKLAPELRGDALDKLERRAIAENLLIVQRDGVHHESPGAAFRRAPVKLTAEGLERRRKMHAGAGQA